MEQDITDLTREIDRLNRQKEIEEKLSQPMNRPITEKPMAGGMPEEKKGRGSEAYKNAMLTALRSNFRRVSNVLQEGVDADGGYLVPDEYEKKLAEEARLEQDLCLDYFRKRIPVIMMRYTLVRIVLRSLSPDSLTPDPSPKGEGSDYKKKKILKFSNS